MNFILRDFFYKIRGELAPRSSPLSFFPLPSSRSTSSATVSVMPSIPVIRTSWYWQRFACGTPFFQRLLKHTRRIRLLGQIFILCPKASKVYARNSNVSNRKESNEFLPMRQLCGYYKHRRTRLKPLRSNPSRIRPVNPKSRLINRRLTKSHGLILPRKNRRLEPRSKRFLKHRLSLNCRLVIRRSAWTGCASV